MGSAAAGDATIAASKAAASCATQTEHGGHVAARCRDDVIAAVVVARMLRIMRATGPCGNLDAVAETGEHT